MSKRILIIDDDLYIRELYEEVLRDEGYEVESAINGKDGLENAQKGGYSLILLDVMMPELDGMGVLDGLSKNPPHVANGPIILLTNLGHDPLIKEARNKGVSSYLIKAEMTPDQLVAHIKKFLGE